MEDLNQAIQGVLQNPEMMKQIMGMAQALGAAPVSSGQPESNDSPQLQEPAGSQDSHQAPAIPGNLGAITGLLSQAGMDGDQQNLLKALSPYLSSRRISKLRKAMEAARLAELATSMMGSSQAGGQNV